MIPAATSAPPIQRRTTRRVAFVPLSGLMALIALVGFWPNYYGPLVAGTLSHPLLIHIHAVVFGAAIVYRRKPPLHRRMMMIAATSLLVAAASRMTFLPPPPQGLPLLFLIWSAPVLAAMAIEFNQTRKVHPVYFAGLGVYLFRLLMPGANTDTWRAFAQWVFGLGVTG